MSHYKALYAGSLIPAANSTGLNWKCSSGIFIDGGKWQIFSDFFSCWPTNCGACSGLWDYCTWSKGSLLSENAVVNVAGTGSKGRDRPSTQVTNNPLDRINCLAAFFQFCEAHFTHIFFSLMKLHSCQQVYQESPECLMNSDLYHTIFTSHVIKHATYEWAQ